MITWIILTISLAGNVLFAWIIKSGARRLLEFDDLFEMLSHDMNTNITYFDSISQSAVVGNSDEIVTADKNMRIMKARLDEYVTRMEELTKRKLRKTKVIPNPPVVR